MQLYTYLYRVARFDPSFPIFLVFSVFGLPTLEAVFYHYYHIVDCPFPDLWVVVENRCDPSLLSKIAIFLVFSVLAYLRGSKHYNVKLHIYLDKNDRLAEPPARDKKRKDLKTKEQKKRLGHVSRLRTAGAISLVFVCVSTSKAFSAS